MKVLVKHTQACWVDFYHEVEIDEYTSPSDVNDVAENAYMDGEGDYIGPCIGDSIGFLDDSINRVDSLPCTLETVNE